MVITMTESDVQRVIRVVLDQDSQDALDFLAKVVKPQIDKALAPSHCRPVFELGGSGTAIVGPPPTEPPEKEGA